MDSHITHQIANKKWQSVKVFVSIRILISASFEFHCLLNNERHKLKYENCQKVKRQATLMNPFSFSTQVYCVMACLSAARILCLSNFLGFPFSFFKFGLIQSIIIFFKKWWSAQIFVKNPSIHDSIWNFIIIFDASHRENNYTIQAQFFLFTRSNFEAMKKRTCTSYKNVQMYAHIFIPNSFIEFSNDSHESCSWVSLTYQSSIFQPTTLHECMVFILQFVSKRNKT